MKLDYSHRTREDGVKSNLTGIPVLQEAKGNVRLAITHNMVQGLARAATTRIVNEI